MRKLKPIGISIALACTLMSTSKSALANDELVGSIFVCGDDIKEVFTFFPNNKYTRIVKFGNDRFIKSTTLSISYSYNGEVLTVKFYGIKDGKPKSLSYNATYLPKKGKLILDDGTSHKLCIER